jgi:hypothetical protein
MSVLEKLVEKLPAEDKAKVKASSRSRGFSGFKAKIRAAFPDLAVEVDVKYAKLTAEEIRRKVRIKHRVEGGVEVYPRRVGFCECGKPVFNQRYVYMDGQGNVYDEAMVKHYQVLDDGREVEVRPFERTRELDVVKLIPASSLHEFLIESEYEVWSENPAGLWRLAEYLIKNDKIAVSTHSFGRGFNVNYALLYPIEIDGKFIMIMALTKMRKVYTRLMPIGIGGEQKPIEEKPTPTILLPEI